MRSAGAVVDYRAISRWINLQGISKSEPVDVVAIARGVVAVAVGHGCVRRKAAVPAAATSHAVRTRNRTSHKCRATHATAIPVPVPFPDISTHIIKSQGIRRLLAHFMSLAAGVIGIPCNISNRVRPRIGVAPGAGGLVSATGGKFPFGFRRQAVALLGCVKVRRFAVGSIRLRINCREIRIGIVNTIFCTISVR